MIKCNVAWSCEIAGSSDWESVLRSSKHHMTCNAGGCGYLAVSQWEVGGASQWRKGTLCSLIWMSYRPYKQQKPVRQTHIRASCFNNTNGMHAWLMLHDTLKKNMWFGKTNHQPSGDKTSHARYSASHLYKVIPHNLGSHQHKHDGKAIGHVPGGFYQDYGETKCHSDNATCQINTTKPYLLLLSCTSFTEMQLREVL